MTETRTLRKPTDVLAFAQMLSKMKLPLTVYWGAAESRTKAQNRLLHRWFSDIARHHSFGQTEAEIKAECNLTYGLPILNRDDPQWASAFGYIFADLSRPAKLKAIRVLDIPFTRRMKVKQLTEYMDAMQRDYAEIGVMLTDPEARAREPA